MTQSLPLADNPAVHDPKKALTRIQREALVAADFYKRHRLVTGAWLLGQKRFAHATLNALGAAGLLKYTPRGFVLTQAGQLALLKLKEKGV